MHQALLDFVSIGACRHGARAACSAPGAEYICFCRATKACAAQHAARAGAAAGGTRAAGDTYMMLYCCLSAAFSALLLQEVLEPQVTLHYCCITAFAA